MINYMHSTVFYGVSSKVTTKYERRRLNLSLSLKKVTSKDMHLIYLPIAVVCLWVNVSQYFQKLKSEGNLLSLKPYMINYMHSTVSCGVSSKVTTKYERRRQVWCAFVGNRTDIPQTYYIALWFNFTQYCQKMELKSES